MPRKLKPLHPGEVLREEFMQPLGLTAYTLAKACLLPRTRIERIMREETGITADTAIPVSYLLRHDPGLLGALASPLRNRNKNAGDRRRPETHQKPSAKKRPYPPHLPQGSSLTCPSVAQQLPAAIHQGSWQPRHPRTR